MLFEIWHLRDLFLKWGNIDETYVNGKYFQGDFFKNILYELKSN